MAKRMTIKIARTGVKKKSKARNGFGSNGKSATATRALAQGVGQTPQRPFQLRNQRAKSVQNYFNALSPCHLPLPRAVGPYTIVRTTQRVAMKDRVFMFFGFVGTHQGNFPPQWNTTCAWTHAGGGADLPISGANSEVVPDVGLVDLALAATVSPAAVSVQIMNPGALTDTTGITYIGRSHAQYDLAGTARTWTELGGQFVSFMSPRICSAGKLALRGVQVNSYPLDMTAVSDFRGIEGAPLGDFVWAESIRPEGFAPVVIYNPSKIELEILVTREWRVRFDPGNPAASSHSYHGTASDSLWDTTCRTAASMGHGCMDIAERVAEMGEAHPFIAAAAGAAAF